MQAMYTRGTRPIYGTLHNLYGAENQIKGTPIGWKTIMNLNFVVLTVLYAEVKACFAPSTGGVGVR